LVRLAPLSVGGCAGGVGLAVVVGAAEMVTVAELLLVLPSASTLLSVTV
jgi:hypothetical protein